MSFLFREDVAPGLRLEMDLNKIFFDGESEFQKIDVVETYFGKVNKCVVVYSDPMLLLLVETEILGLCGCFLLILDFGHGRKDSECSIG